MAGEREEVEVERTILATERPREITRRIREVCAVLCQLTLVLRSLKHQDTELMFYIVEKDV